MRRGLFKILSVVHHFCGERLYPTALGALLAALPLLASCGAGDRPDIGEVSGVITFDGQPLANASVAFSQNGFRPSIGQTDVQGRYELIYLRDIKGAAVGKHSVKIKQFGQRKTQVPRRYNDDTELTAEVEPGENKIDFDLTSNP